MAIGPKERRIYLLLIPLILVAIGLTFVPGIRERFQSQTLVARAAPNLIAVAAEHVRIAETTRGSTPLWGRIGGSQAERESAMALASQLVPYVDEVAVEPYQFTAHRPIEWTLSAPGGQPLASAVPAPFDARFPGEVLPARIHPIATEADWAGTKGRWAFVRAVMERAASDTSVRRDRLYQMAVKNGAVGFVFALPTPPGTWRSVVPVDKPFAMQDVEYPDGVRPIPCFSVDAEDGDRIEAMARDITYLGCRIDYASPGPLEGFNTVSRIPGQGKWTVLLAAHLDSFFSGANDDASGLATLVGMAHRLMEIPKERRVADFLLVGLSAHHDAGAGMRAFVENAPRRMDIIRQFILLEHTDAQHGAEGKGFNWPDPLNDGRTAYLGDRGFPTIREALPDLVANTGIMGIVPPMLDACIADLYVVCDRVEAFCLIQAPPYYHTDHDTMDKLSEEGLQNAVEFHMRLLETIGALAIN